MNKQQKQYVAFMESICDKLNCREAIPALQEGFKAYCEAYAAGDPSPILTTPKERLDRFHNFTNLFDEQPYKDKAFTPKQYKEYLKRVRHPSGHMIDGYNNDKWGGYGYVRPEKHHEGRLADYINDRALKPTEDMFERQYDNVVKKCESLIHSTLGDASRYLHSYENRHVEYSHIWKYEGPDGELVLSYGLPYETPNDYIDDCLYKHLTNENYNKAVDEYLNEDLNKPIGGFVLTFKGERIVWKDTNDITSAGEHKRSPLNMLAIYTNLLYDTDAREEGDENTKEFWMNRMDEGIYDPETDMS